MSHRISRRKFLRGSVLTAIGAALSACAQPTPAVVEKPVTVVVEKQVPVEKQVVSTVVVEKQVPVEKVVKETVVVEKIQMVTPTPVPATATPLPPTATPKPTFKLTEAPMLANMVKQGRLPPLTERIPASPFINNTAPDIGKYSAVCTLPHESTLDIPVNFWITGEYSRTTHIWNESLTQFGADETHTEPGASGTTTIEPNLGELDVVGGRQGDHLQPA